MSIKVAFHIHNLNRGGAERVVVNLAQHFVRDGFETSIITMEKAETEYEVPKGVRRICLTKNEEKKTPGLIRRLVLLRKKSRLLREVLKKERPDIVIAFDKSASFRACDAAKGICPVLVSVRNDPAKDFSGRANQFFCRKYLYRADGCVFQTRQAQEFFPDSFAKKSRIIINPLNEKYQKVDGVKDEEREDIIVTAGRISAQKNQVLLVRAFARAKREALCMKNTKLRIYGKDSHDGSMQRIEEAISDNDLKDYVNLMGNSDSLEKELIGAKMFAFSSDYEGMPNALMEAMAMGIPSISTDCPCGGPAELIEDGENGLLVSVGDERALADAMVRLYSDDALRIKISERGLEMRERADGARIFGEWKAYVIELLDSAGRCRG